MLLLDGQYYCTILRTKNETNDETRRESREQLMVYCAIIPTDDNIFRLRRAHSPTFPSLHLRHNSFSNPSIALPTSQLILQPFRCFTYVTVHSPTLLSHSPTFPSLHLHHNSFSNPSIALPTSQLILQPFFRFSYVTSSSHNTPGEPPMDLSCSQ